MDTSRWVMKLVQENVMEAPRRKTRPVCIITVPVRRNCDRNLHTPLTWEDFEKEVTEFSDDKAFSGPKLSWPVLKETRTTPGRWGGTSDVNRTYKVYVPEDRLDEFRELVRRQRGRFHQLSFAVEIEGRGELIPDEGELMTCKACRMDCDRCQAELEKWRQRPKI